MKLCYPKSLAALVALAAMTDQVLAQPATLVDALAQGKASGSFNLRYEGVDEDNALKNASALTLRSVINYASGTLDGFSGVLEAQDIRTVMGVDDYSVPQTGFKTGQYSTIADPRTTELSKGFLQYVDGKYMARIGRQDLRYDNQRFVGAVGWRQDNQDFDALTLEYKDPKALTIDYNFIGKRNRIFAQAADIDSKDNLLHLSYPTPIGTLVGYAYLLKEDIVLNNKLDTYGVRLTGAQKLSDINFTYTAEYATQKYERGAAAFTADYFTVEGGATYAGVTAKLGYESLGSDNGLYGFSTPLATLHLFQGWADEFLTTPNQGIQDAYGSIGGNVGGGALTFAYHDYTADVSAPTIHDLGSEFDVQWTLPFMKKFVWGVKYADYQNGDIAAKVDKTILWSWLQLSF